MHVPSKSVSSSTGCFRGGLASPHFWEAPQAVALAPIIGIINHATYTRKLRPDALGVLTLGYVDRRWTVISRCPRLGNDDSALARHSLPLYEDAHAFSRGATERLLLSCLGGTKTVAKNIAMLHVFFYHLVVLCSRKQSSLSPTLPTGSYITLSMDQDPGFIVNSSKLI